MSFLNSSLLRRHTKSKSSLLNKRRKPSRSRRQTCSTRSVITVETLEARRVLAALVAVDFDLAGGSAPTNWTSIGTSGTPLTQSNLVDEDGNATTIDLTISETGTGSTFCGANEICGAAATINSTTIPIHDQPLAGIDGQFFTDADPVTLTWSGLTSGTDYEVYVFALEGFYGSIVQDVQITGQNTESFTQNVTQNELVINDQTGASTAPLSSYAKLVTADSDGEIEIQVTPNGFTLDVSLGGVAIREASAPELTLSIVADSVSEGAGVGATTALVSRNTETTGSLTVSLASDDTGEATVPATVTIPAGQTSATFSIDAVDDAVIDGTQTVTITASASGLADGTDTLDVTDDDASALSVVLSASAVSESDANPATTGVVTRNSDNTSALTVNLLSSDTSEATVIASVTIAAGQTSSAPFDIDVVDDGDNDGTQAVTITATAAAHADGVAALDVVDDEVLAALTTSVVADSVSESAGAAATTAIVTRTTGLLVNRAERGIRASDGVNVDQIDSTTAAGTFDSTVRRENPADASNNHVVDQESSINGSGIDGTGFVEIRDEEDFFRPVDDASIFDVYFDLETTHTFTLSGSVLAESDNASAFALVSLTGPGTTLSFSESANAIDVGGSSTINESGTLAPGTYHFVARAEASSAGNNADADADFTFDLQLEAAALVGSLASSDTSEANVPATVAFAAGQSATPAFNVDAVDDTDVDGTQTVSITASAASHSSVADTLDVTDDEVGSLTLDIALASISEGAGAVATTATVSRNTASPTPLVVNLSSSDTTEANVPTSVTIAANQTTSAPFNIDAVDDAIVDGTQTVTITASAASHGDGIGTIDVTDDDAALLTVAIVADSVSESDGAAATTAVVTRNSPTAEALVVTLSSDDTTEATVPASVTIAAGQTTSAPFNIDAVNDAIVDGTQVVTVTASAVGHADGSDTLGVSDDDAAVLTLQIVAEAVSEGDGAGATTATVTRNTSSDSALTVTLSSSDTSEAIVQASVTIPAGQLTSPAFDIDAVDDLIIDGTQSVTITASASQHADGSDVIDVTDDDAAGFSIAQTDGYTLVFEDGTTDQWSVVLDSAPSSDVVISISGVDETEFTISSSALTFGTDNWDVPQVVTVTGVDDTLVDGNQVTSLVLSIDDAASDDAFDDLADQVVEVTTRDVDGAIQGTVWDDADGSQTQNAGEVGIAGVTVYLDLNRNGQLDGGEPTQVTAADGSYTFDELAAGEYVVTQVVPNGLAQTFPQVVGSPGTFAELVNNQSSLSVYATHAPRDVGRLFILEKNSGTIQILDLATGQLNATPFLTIPDVDASANEAGLLGLAFHPDYANNGKFYVNVTVDSDATNFATHIREYTVSADPNIADPDSGREILSFDQPFGNHNGGWIGFSPIDEFLYIGSGDGGSGGDPLNSGQSLDTLLGKMLRIDVNGDDFPSDDQSNYAIPPSNPFVETAGARDEIWAYGLRNPWRDSFDRQTGDLWIGDVGQNAREEINFQSASSSGGEDYAWNRREGFLPFNGGASLPGDVEPVYDYEHGSGDFQGNSVIGGHVYRGPIGAFEGLYIFADSRSSNVWAFDPADPINSVTRLNDLLVPDAGSIGGGPIPDDIVSFAEDGTGNLYMVQIDGEIHKISANLPGTQTVLVQAGQTVTDVNFGNQDPQASSISDFVWHDLDGDGIQDSGEPGLDQVTVNLRDATTLQQLDTTTTAGGGQYSFGGLAAGEYVVEFQTPANYRFSPSDQGFDDLVDSDADRSSGRTDRIVLAASTNVSSVDAGMFQLATIGDRVWDDANGNGAQDEGELELNGVTVELLGQRDDFQDGTVQGWITAPLNPNPPQNLPDDGPGGTGDSFLQFSSNGGGGAGGRLVIRNVSQWTGDLSRMQAIRADMNNPGDTTVQMRIAINGAGGWFAGTDAASQIIEAGSDWSSVVFSLDPADLTNELEPDSVNEAGFDLAATLADVSEIRILNSDGPNFRAEPSNSSVGIDNITAIEGTQVTEGDGNYSFSVIPGTYQAVVGLLPGYVFSPSDQADDEIDSDVNSLGQAPPVTVESGDTDSSIDAGMFVQALTVTIDASSFSESAGSQATTATVSRNGDTTGPLIVTLTSSDETEATVPTSVTIAAGQSTSAPFVISAVDDAIADGTQTVTISAEADSYAAGSDSVDVTDDDSAGLTVAIASESISEGGGAEATTATVSRNSDTTAALQVTLASDDLSEATVPLTVTIAAGQTTSAPFNIGAVEDLIVDGTQTVTITATASGHTDGTGSLQVTDNDTAALSVVIAAASISEGDGPAATTAIVSRNTPTTNELTVQLSSSDTTETNSAAAVVIPAGQTSSLPFNIDAIDDDLMDGTQTVTFTASAAGHAPGNDTVDVTDDDVATLTLVISAVSISEGDGSDATTATVSRNTNTSEALTVQLSSSDISEAIVPATITIPAGETTSLPFDISAVEDEIVDGTQIVVITASAASHADGAGELQVTDNDIAMLTLIIDADGVSESAGVEATKAIVRRNTDTSEALVVALGSSDDTEATVPATVTIPAGALESESFAISAVDDDLVDGTQTVIVTATAAGHEDASDSLDVTDDDEPELNLVIDAGSISENGGVTTATVSRNTVTTEALVVTLVSSDTTEAVAPETITIPADATTASFEIRGVDDAIVDGTQTVTITASSDNSHAPSSATLEVTDDEASDIKILTIETSATEEDKAKPGETVKVAGTFSGGGDNLIAEIQWGDGTSSLGTIGDGSFAGQHEYQTGGIFEIIVTLRDDPQGEVGEGGAKASIHAYVSGVRLTDQGTLQIVGTKRRDRISLSKSGDSLRVKTKFGAEKWTRADFHYDEVKRIELIACGGNDNVTISSQVAQPANISAGPGHDIIRGGNGDTTIDGGPGNDFLFTRDGNDVVTDLEGHNWVRSGSGDDMVSTGVGVDYVVTSKGNDIIKDLGGNNAIHSGPGDDVVSTGDGRDYVSAGSGDDTVSTAGGNDWVRASSGDDVVDTGDGNDHVDAGSGNDLVRGGNGNDYINGASGHDILLGEAGRDRLIGSGGRDLLIGGLDKDQLIGGGDQDLLIGGVTDHDSNDTGLKAILAEWASGASYADRVAKIRGESEELFEFLLNTSTVDDDEAKDTVWGSGGQDWFFAKVADDGVPNNIVDKLKDRRSNEELDAI